MSTIPQNAALVLIDVQNVWDHPKWGRRNNPEAETNIARLLHAWRETKRPLFYFQHLETGPNTLFKAGTVAAEIRDIVRPLEGETILQKKVHSAFMGTDFEERLRNAGITTLFITGFMTNGCVETTARMAGDLDFQTFVVSDGTATFDRSGPDGILHPAEEVHTMSLLNLHQTFATIVTTAEVLRDLA
ncbi:isochorismatase [Dictyobacter vulcani]|uniref:Isochorismatase n=1 Tax=Dictyobacter vulcani TaxID=2607529 RepID=A0A5J4KU79_9CHLR|nr:cysteine hydrolase family protein [Dictyobacter vulcani]GER90041.1 isochorismatase [Dictyobacter vulcani]